jgi:hypothetical protein
MKRWIVALAWGIVLGASIGSAPRLSAQDHTLFVDPEAENLFRYARMAVGGGGVSRLKALELKGRSRIIDNDGRLVAATVDIKMLLPDYYLRVDTIGARQKVAGYANKTVLSAIRENGNVEYPPSQLEKPILRNERLRADRFLLGAITYAGADRSLTISSIGRAGEMIDPRQSARSAMRIDQTHVEPNVFAVRGDDLAARVEIDSATRLPVRLRFPAGDSSEAVLAFEDRREVDGLKLPYRVVMTEHGQIVDELLLDMILVNPELGKGDFKK